jgi:FixJ family two-component response regulator
MDSRIGRIRRALPLLRKSFPAFPSINQCWWRNNGGMKHPGALISVVDDDVSLRESLPELLQTFGFAARAFASAQEFLDSDALIDTRCLILDVSMPGMSGPQLQSELSSRELTIPIVFITALSDPQLRSVLLARGAIECISKPFSERDLRSVLDRALCTG